MQLKFQFFWDTTPCRRVKINRRFKTASFVQLQSRQRKEDGGRKRLRNVCNYLAIRTTKYSRRSQFSTTALWGKSGIIMQPIKIAEQRELGRPKTSRKGKHAGPHTHHIHAYIHTYLNTYVHTYIHTYIHT